MPRHRQTTAPSSGSAVAYLRVSTDEQRESGLGLEAQAASIDIAAKRHSLQVRETFTDAGLSGGLPIDKRPQLAAAIAALHPGDVLMVAKRDRLGRDVIHMAVIEGAAQRKGARIISAAGEGTDSDPNDPSGFLNRLLIDGFAQYERLIIASRTRAAIRAKAARGERYSGALPYGFQLAADGRMLEPCERERKILALMREARIDLGLTWLEMARLLNREGYRTRRGTSWSLHAARGVFLTAQQNQPASGSVLIRASQRP